MTLKCLQKLVVVQMCDLLQVHAVALILRCCSPRVACSAVVQLKHLQVAWDEQLVDVVPLALHPQVQSQSGVVCPHLPLLLLQCQDHLETGEVLLIQHPRTSSSL